jgi:hypothetical protein
MAIAYTYIFTEAIWLLVWIENQDISLLQLPVAGKRNTSFGKKMEATS